MSKQKNTKKKYKNRRESQKFPALTKATNLNIRADYIEAEYINGVYDEKGNQLIRPLNDEEKEFLNKFYEETVVTNMDYNEDIVKLKRKKKMMLECDQIKQLRDKMKKIKENMNEHHDPQAYRELKKYRAIIRVVLQQNEDKNYEKIKDINKELEELRQKTLLYPDKADHKVFYHDNYARRNCIFNRTKVRKLLDSIDMERYDHYMEKNSVYDYEDCLIDFLESDDWEEEKEELNNFLRLIEKDEQSQQ